MNRLGSTYRKGNLGGGSALGQRLVLAVGGRVVDLLEAQAVLAVGDLEADDEVLQLGDDVQERLVAGLEEGGVPRADAALELVRLLLSFILWSDRPNKSFDEGQQLRYAPAQCTPGSPCPP